ncbi:MAG: glutamate-5-semialdehyde dehydrogenase [Caulobacterales bacterium]|nr:glutamate-5-semialdehyde dehydrogenase [Caulobacterales bacterium]MCA0372136.1 glutamate-5-semialdehyde dehydrogenase [Pseudomonadota bacterium]
MTQNSIKILAVEIGTRARNAYAILANSSKETRDNALIFMAQAIFDNKDAILSANKIDYENAKKDGLSDAMLDRLMLDEKRLMGVAEALKSIAAQPDQNFEVIETYNRPNGLKIDKVRIPLGVIGIIYESRPNVTADAGGLCLRGGNAAVLRGGKEAFLTSTEIANALRAGLAKAGLPEDCVQFVPTTDRDFVGEMLRGLNGAIDLIIPRGGKTLVARVLDEAKVPVLAHLEGMCHTYIHQDADEAKAIAIVLNAKMRRTGICGATETLLIDEKIAAKILPKIATALNEAGCELRGDEKARAICPMNIANEEDWSTEYLAPILAIKIVDNLEDAINHIGKYGSHHTDAIITENEEAARIFSYRVDSAIVMHNASTQFADGGEFGFGGEIGIGTGRLHARGPVGAQGLTTYKYIVHGTGQTRP